VETQKLLEVIDETANRLAYCIDLYEMPEEAVAMIRGEIDHLNEVLSKNNYEPQNK